LIRVTDSTGNSATTKAAAKDGKFTCQYPNDFPGAPALRPGMLYIDATDFPDFDVSKSGNAQAEVAVIVHGGKKLLPDFPDLLTTDLRDREGRTDKESSKWPSACKLLNLYMHSRAARLTGVDGHKFDLANPASLEWFKNNLSVYDFEHRDRDWSSPLGARVARTFWQGASDSWFNSSNDNPLDGNPRNRAMSNYRPYGFSNDLSDWVILGWMRTRAAAPFDDNQLAIDREATQNLLAMQHRDPSNFALPDVDGKREHYTAGAFRYGMFTNGEFMTEGNGWFYNPAFKDYIRGGVLNGRCLWALGEALRDDPKGPLASQIKDGIRLGLKFCLHDGVEGGYTKKTRKGNNYWFIAGEHAYLVLGMLAAYDADPKMEMRFDPEDKPVKLKDLCVSSLNALVDLKKPGEMWSSYPNEDAIAIAALAQGAMLFKGAPDEARWLDAATRVADAWLEAKVDPKERKEPCVNFGYRPTPKTMTHNWMKMGKVQFFYYLTGHWIHALSDLHAATGNPRYQDRAVAMTTYLCGNNPLRVRLLNETGGVYNWSDDTDGDGIEDKIKQDMYAESSAFSQIGILRLLENLP
jgi:hypothetical protein